MLSCSTLAGAALAQPSTSAAEGANGPQESGLQDIVVTAQKRTQNLQVVPIAVTALTGQTLQAVRFANVKDLNAVAPGLTVREGAGGSQIPVFTMRGVYGSTTYASEAGVALYVDGIYINGSAGAQFDLADVERIEVLRGPQGTLFGRNAIGGAVNLITREPSGRFEGRQELAYGNLGQFRSKTRIDLPSWGPLSASLTYLHNQRRGDVRNLGAGTVWDYGPGTNDAYGKRTSPKYLGDQNVNAVSAAVKLDPGAGIKAIYRYDFTHNRFSPDAVGYVSSTPFVDSVLAAQPDPSILTAPSRERPDAVNNAYTTMGTLRVQNHSLTISAPLAEGVSIKNITAFRKVHMDTTNQLDGLGGLVFPGTATPYLVLVNATLSNQRTFSDEFQLNINTDWFNLTAGLLHFHSFTVEGGFPEVTNASFNVLVPGFVIPQTGAQPSRVKVDSDAVYVQNEIHVTRKLDIVMGARLTKDVKSGIDNSPTPFGAPVPIDYKRSTPTYLAGLNYRLSDGIFTYAKFSTAYISGGGLAGITFAPTTAKSWEAGIKSDLFDRRLRVNLALFTVKYKDVQILTNPQNPGCIGGSPFASQCIINGGDARAKGVELETTLVPLPGLTLQGNVSYTDFKYTRVNPAVLSPDGLFLPNYRPKWTGTASAQYSGEQPLIAGAHLIARADATYSSSAFGTPNSTLAVLNLGKIPSSWIVNGRVGLAGFDLGLVKMEVAGWVKNLTDNRSITYSADLGVNDAVNYQRARAFGIDANFDF